MRLDDLAMKKCRTKRVLGEGRVNWWAAVKWCVSCRVNTMWIRSSQEINGHSVRRIEVVGQKISLPGLCDHTRHGRHKIVARMHLEARVQYLTHIIFL